MPIRQAAFAGAKALALVTIAACAGLTLARASQDTPSVKVAASPAVRAAIAAIAPAFEREAGRSVEVDYDVFAVISRRLRAGERFDVVVLSPDLVRAMTGEQYLRPGSVNLGRQGVGLAARLAEPVPQASRTDDLRRTLVQARSIAYFREGTAGTHFLQVVERLGLSGRLAGVLRGYDAAEIEQAIAGGAVQYVTAGTATLRGLKGLGEVSPLPPEFQTYTSYVAALAVAATNPNDAKAFLQFLTSSRAREALAASGFEAVTP